MLLGLLAASGPSATLASDNRIDPAFDRGLARESAGWVVSGRDGLARLDDQLVPATRVDDAIPADWRERGFDRIGDIDVSGTTLYVPFEQSDDDEGRQAMARYDARTLAFRDATIVDQHENPFVAVDGGSGIAYSMDRAGGDELVRYDVRAGWRRLPPLPLDRVLERVQGGAVAREAVWLVTDDDDNTMYRVDITTGEVSDLGAAPPVAGAAAGIDASSVGGDDLHATVVNANEDAVDLGHFTVSGEPAPASAVPRPSTNGETSWPPALVYFAILLLFASLGAVGTVFWRARKTVRPNR
jgi:hypothetical protein